MAQPTPNATLPPRRIILCFDGTGNKFGENSNVVRFFRALLKDNHESQLVYYQPGIGTYNERQFFTRTASSIVTSLDQGVALYINDHVKEGYQYIMRNYRVGDKICLFGFSRGAHTARVVAGMLYKVGVLPAHNDQQLNFAFTVYQTTGDLGYKLSREFKKTFAIPVTVEFVGVWDTVSSVGIIPRTHPYTSVNYAVKHFRHALALDERRARFRPNVWNEPTIEREEDLDVDEPDVNYPSEEDRDGWMYQPPNRNKCDVEEVWFTGCHADIGGGSHENQVKDSLSHIPLRWMIKECYMAKTGIRFNHDYLEELGFDLLELAHYLEDHGLDVLELGFDIEALKALAEVAEKNRSQDETHTSSVPIPNGVVTQPPALNSVMANFPRISNVLLRARARADALAQKFDQLVLVWQWWGLEILPMLATYQNEKGVWIRRRMRNFGQGRYIPFFDEQVKVHSSVRERIKETANNETPYTPSAYNWDLVQTSGMLTYVD